MKKTIVIFIVVFPAILSAQKKVGVGTVSPEQRLSVDSTLVVDQGNFDDGNKPSLRFGSGSGEAIGSRRIVGGSNPFGIDFWTGFNKRMVLTNAGNFGIGTDTPSVALAVNGDVLVDYHSTNNGISGKSLRFGNANSGEGISSARSGSINLNGLNLFTSFTPRLSITNEGKVGIRTTDPLYALHIKAVPGDQVVSYGEGDNANFASTYMNGTSATAHVGYLMLHQGTIRGFVGINPGSDLILGRVRPAQGLQAALTISNNTGFAGINVSNPLYQLELFDTAASGIPAYIHSNNASQALFTVGADALNAFSGVGYARNNSIKAIGGLNAANNFVINVGSAAVDNITATPSGNTGINNPTPGFPLNFAATLGEKISLYGNSGNNYGIGIGTNALQLHTDAPTADILFGYGSSASFNETMRIKGNGSLLLKGDLVIDANGTNNATFSPGIRFGTATSGEAIASRRTPGGNQNGLDFYTNGINRMSINNNGLVNFAGTVTTGQIGVNTNSPVSMLEVRNGGLGISSPTKLWELNYDNTNGYFYIDEFGTARRLTIKNGGNVGINTASPSEKLEVVGNGKFSGDLTVQSGKGMVRNYSSTQLKTETFTYTFPGLVTLGAGNTTNLAVTFPEAYAAAPMVYVAGLLPSAGSGGYVECVYNVTGISTTGFTLNIYNPRGTGAVFNNGSPNFMLNVVAVGAQ